MNHPRPRRPAVGAERTRRLLRPSLDETTLSPAERRFVADDVDEHRLDAVIRTTFGGGDPDRLLDFPPARR